MRKTRGGAHPGHRSHRASRRRALALVASALPAALARSADAAYPSRPIRFVAPFPSGGTTDLLARLIGARLGLALGQPIIVENRPGAAGTIGAEQAAKAAPDGYTLLLASNGTNTTLRDRPREGGNELLRAFTPVAKIAELPIVVVVSPSLGVATLDELLARARTMPGQLAYATSDIGSTSHLAAALLFRRANVALIHVPYSGTAAAVKDVIASEVPILFSHLGTVAPYLRDGRLKALAVTGTHRMPHFERIPTVAESGFDGFEVSTWHGVLVPIATPAPIVRRLHDELARIVAMPEMREDIERLGMEPSSATPERFAAEMEADAKRWSAVLRDLRTSDP
jgi:tripartite-type tricarboxylate transporter receptor subunit TctC